MAHTFAAVVVPCAEVCEGTLENILAVARAVHPGSHDRGGGGLSSGHVFAPRGPGEASGADAAVCAFVADPASRALFFAPLAGLADDGSMAFERWEADLGTLLVGNLVHPFFFGVHATVEVAAIVRLAVLAVGSGLEAALTRARSLATAGLALLVGPASVAAGPHGALALSLAGLDFEASTLLVALAALILAVAALLTLPIFAGLASGARRGCSPIEATIGRILARLQRCASTASLARLALVLAVAIGGLADTILAGLARGTRRRVAPIQAALGIGDTGLKRSPRTLGLASLALVLTSPWRTFASAALAVLTAGTTLEIAPTQTARHRIAFADL